ncbi:tRNA (adenosine(37)-N6)-threonylcarbamoyltransferase complex ATPase subunit type 1 TsaE [Aquimarina hainanensis]|uniref:tRNA threonylcarbamoyladenosine biosynthesis protein TsaE n=1 Tax=Aquimarina hainanensis TaxID=1578017 RepID=A0ABW5NDR7_9FLAO|nr:tRNA (adenosine(37)-N6)-threonylcarbamoyltransferase complex ATPase subunit type 1 TsaE [Aquimarina sp. TRL1]QKX06500.1 tRNA (adenosine(37)-N6)-threonylcarbamoyltransferase complex ATPase subunit type 1 TsaE [Aquimarina sp. TRL1]
MKAPLEYTIEEISDIASKIIQDSDSKVLLFTAEMGVGKTTLIKEICKQLGVSSPITSPTYSLVNEYEGTDSVIYHFDFYRINDEEEAYDIGFEEYLNTDSWIFIEWPDKIKNLLPQNTRSIQINTLPNQKRAIIF